MINKLIDGNPNPGKSKESICQGVIEYQGYTEIRLYNSKKEKLKE